jgi:hypothetical protein
MKEFRSIESIFWYIVNILKEYYDKLLYNTSITFILFKKIFYSYKEK